MEEQTKSEKYPNPAIGRAWLRFLLGLQERYLMMNDAAAELLALKKEANEAAKESVSN